MKNGLKFRQYYDRPDLIQMPLELDGALLECSVRVDANNLDVESYHDFFSEEGLVSKEGDPFAIGF